MSDDSRKFKAVDDDARVKRVKNSFVCEIASVEEDLHSSMSFTSEENGKRFG